MKADNIRAMVRTGVALAVCLVLPAGLVADSLPGFELEYEFNGTGTTATNTGSVVGTTYLWDSTGAETDLHSAGGTGVSGEANDRAFDNTASVGMGGAGGVAMGYPDVGLPTPLKSLTITGWIRDLASSGTGTIFHTGGGITARTALFSQHPGILSLQVGDGSSNGNGASTFAAYDEALASEGYDKWVFFAVTYDGTEALDNIKFYIGDTSTAASFVSASTTPITSTVTNTSYGIGHYNTSLWGPGSGGAFDGKLDNFRLLVSPTDGSGALSLSQIESIRASDVPEPGTVLLLGLGGVLILARRR